MVDLIECDACNAGNCRACTGTGCACFERTCEAAQKGPSIYWNINPDGTLDGPYQSEE